MAANADYEQYGHPAGTVQIWDASSGEELVRLNLDDAVSVDFSPTGQVLATGSFDGAVRVWDAEDGRLLLATQVHFGAIRQVVFTPDGSRLVAGSQDGTISIFGLPEP